MGKGAYARSIVIDITRFKAVSKPQPRPFDITNSSSWVNTANIQHKQLRSFITSSNAFTASAS